MTLDTYHKGGYPAYLIHVPGRDRILIHAANLMTELSGCIAPGKSIGFITGKLAVMQSKVALAKFMDVMQEVTNDYITITNPP